MSRAEQTRIAGVVLFGVAVRLVFLLWVTPLEPRADEGSYIYQALALDRFGFYLGSTNWAWPPAYPAYLAFFFRYFGEGGVFAAKLGQVLLSGVVGLSVVLLARRLFTARAGLIAGLLWAVYLPLIGFTHYLWPETLFLALFLPAIVLFLAALDEPDAPGASVRLLAVGLLIGGTGLFKQATLPLLVFLPLLFVACARRISLSERLSRAALLVFSAILVLLPWTLRTYEVYGHAVASATLGENMYQGVNAGYINYDYAVGAHTAPVDPAGWTYRWFVRPPAGAEKWQRSDEPNPIARDKANAARGKRFAREYPGFYLRSRVKKLADWVTPLNFFQRHVRLNRYAQSIRSPKVAATLALASVGMTALVLAGSIGGLFLAVRRARHRWVMLAVVVTFLAGVLVVSMSRYRVPAEPCLLILCAGFVTGRPWRVSPTARRLAIGAWLLLAFLWTVNATEILAMLEKTLR